MSSTDSPPFAFSRAAATPQNKCTSTRGSHETCSIGNTETTTASSSPSAGSPILAIAPSSGAPSPQDQMRGIPNSPCHLAAGAGNRQRPATVPGPTFPMPVGSLSAMRPRQTFEQPCQGLRPDSAASEELLELDCEEDCASRSGQPFPGGSVKARQREDSAGFLSPPFSQPSPRAALTWLTQQQRDITRTDQRCLPPTLTLTGHHLRLRYGQRRELVTRFTRLGVERISCARAHTCSEPNPQHRQCIISKM